jgi:hypothetical protein
VKPYLHSKRDYTPGRAKEKGDVRE